MKKIKKKVDNIWKSRYILVYNKCTILKYFKIGNQIMLEIERFEKILLELEKKGRLSYQELDELIDVSNSTCNG